MTIRVSGKGISVSEALRGRISDRSDDVLRKYFDGNFSGHVTIGKDKSGFRTDCMFHLDSGMTLEADSTATDAYASADQALIQIEKRLRRYKSRLKDRSARKSYAVAANEALAALNVPSYVIEAPPIADDEEIDAFNPVIIAEATKPLRRLSVSEAVMELDLTGAPVVVFVHGTSGRVNVIYRRADGNIGWVDPPAVNS
jgi:putative sigma-54 modulation protein